MKTNKTWEEKIKADYKDILSEEQINTTIEYWKDIIDEERKKAIEEIRDNLQENNSEPIKRGLPGVDGISGADGEKPTKETMELIKNLTSNK